MTRRGPGPLKRDQPALAHRVCDHTRSLDLRIPAHNRPVRVGTATCADDRAVYGWLVEADLSGQLAGLAAGAA
jgi:hypothetical protein